MSLFIADSLGYRNVLRTDQTDLEFIFKVLKYPRSNDVAMHGNERPEAFRRPTNTIPTMAEDPIGETSML